MFVWPTINVSTEDTMEHKLTDQELEILGGRLFRTIEVDEDTNCWNCTRTKNHDGYAYIQFKQRAYRAHRIAWIVKNQERIPDAKVIRHLCHNPACINPKHLEIGTQRDNVMDSVRAGRRKIPAPRTHAETLSIYQDRRPQEVVARAHGVTIDVVKKIWYGATGSKITGHQKPNWSKKSRSKR